MPGQSTKVRGVPWVQDRLVIRPVLDETAKPFEIVAETEEAVLASAAAFLTRRFGRMSTPAAPCTEMKDHIRLKTAPLRWHDKLS